MENKRLGYVSKLGEIANILQSSKSDKDINNLIIQLTLVLYDIQGDYSVLADANKLVEQISSFKRQTLPKEMLILSIKALSGSIAKSEKKTLTLSNQHRVALIQLISDMSDEDVESLFASCSQQFKS